jgi:Amidohydrolase/Amino acid permease
MVAGIVIGASIFVQPSEISRLVPSAGGMLLVWLVSGLLTFIGSLVCAELASAFPRTGGVYVFLKETYSPAVGFLWGWAMFWMMHSGIVAAIAVVVARYVGYFVALSDAGVKLVAIRPVWEVANDLGAIIHIHPTSPVGVEAMKDYWLMPLVGFPLDTTLAAASLVFSGTAARYPRIKWVLGHLGGAIPYLVERLDRGFHAFKECRANIDRPPSESLKEFYYDSVNFDVRALKLAIEFAGADHILAGSDYPHQIGSLRRMLDSIAALPITEGERAGILGGNAARLLNLD